ncbi:condensation domain-containing protein [Pseudomonas sp. 5P_3.1_Bac2]|uniref:condensation domain-containing protein n=1 Tax=Pseudomonas sp. 5P_3.1_Bac2 TaxID=2971617 RepID=UPI0021C57DBA|nr:condensation domain-containing protein [Pseudomonas sp. 5P_3.1_Bac2]MCU1717153.1 condensation domain-containing protein [Pseudomonas sp. 5P_3.1_Bac2]
MMENIPNAAPHLPVSLYQEQLWLIQQQQPQQCFQQLRAWRLAAAVDINRLTAAIHSVVTATPALSSRLVFSDDGDLQHLASPQRSSGWKLLQAPSTAAAQQLLLSQQAAPWDAEQQPPFQALLVITPEQCVLGLLVHRLLDEQFSPEQVLRAIDNTYHGQALNLAPQTTPLLVPQSTDNAPIHWLRSEPSAVLIRSSYAAPYSQPLTQHWHSRISGLTATQLAVLFALFIAKQGQQPALGLQVRQHSGLSRLVLGPLCSEQSIGKAISEQTDSDQRLLNNAQLPWLYVQLCPAAERLHSELFDEELLLPSAEQRPDLELSITPNGDQLALRLSTGAAVNPALAEQLLRSFLSQLAGHSGVALPPLIAPPSQPAGALSPEQTAQIILQQFRSALDEPTMQVGDDFFDFGGHSLLATRIIGKLQNQHGIELQFNDFFSAPTAQQLAACAQFSQPKSSHAQTPTSLELKSPLALAQATLWRAYKAFDFGKIFNLPFAVHFLEPVDEEVFKQAFSDLLIRHASLRTLYNEADGVAYQQLVPVAELDQYQWFWSSAESVGLSVKDEAQHQFDLTRELPLRVRFFTDAQSQQQSLSLLVQHMAIDEWSLNVMLDELAHAYLARAKGQTPVWSTEAASFHDFAREQVRQGLDLQHLKYWTSMLRDATRGLNLPLTPEEAQAGQSSGVAADWLAITPSQATIDKLYSVAREQQSSLFSLVYSAIAIALHKLGQLPDLIIGTSASGRSEAQYHQSVGYFTTMVAHRVQFSGQHSVAQLIKQVTQTINTSMPYADVPLEHIQQALGMTAADGLLFDVYVQIHADNALNGELRSPEGKAIRYRQIDPDKTESMFGLQFEIMENFLDGQRCLRLLLTHRLERYPHALAQRISRSIEQLLERFTQDDLNHLSLAQIEL